MRLRRGFSSGIRLLSPQKSRALSLQHAAGLFLLATNINPHGNSHTGSRTESPHSRRCEHSQPDRTKTGRPDPSLGHAYPSKDAGTRHRAKAACLQVRSLATEEVSPSTGCATAERTPAVAKRLNSLRFISFPHAGRITSGAFCAKSRACSHTLITLRSSFQIVKLHETAADYAKVGRTMSR